MNPDNPFDQYQNKPDYFLEGESTERSINQVNQRISSLTKSKGKRRWMYPLIAASVLFILAFIFLFPKSPSNQIMAEQNLEHFENFVSPKTRGSDQTTTIQLAYREYEKRNYTGAIHQFQNSESIQPVDQLYLGISQAMNQQWEDAHQTLVSIQNIPAVYQHTYSWVLALTSLATDGQTEATPLLQKVEEQGGLYSEQARRLLKQFSS